MSTDKICSGQHVLSDKICSGQHVLSKLIAQFGSLPITADLLSQFETVTGRGPAHPFLKRGLFFSHRDLDLLLTAVESKKPIYIYTGRGPSAGSFHLGHLVPFMFTVYLQKVLDAHVVIQITDDEKFTHRDCTLAEIEEYTAGNIKDIIACGFDPTKTFIFSNFDYINKMYKNIVQIQSKLTNSQVFSTFGVKATDNIGKTAFCATQIAPSIPSSFAHIDKDALCVIPCGIDQDPYFRLGRDVLQKMGIKKPVLLHGNFVPSLQGVTSKMSSSEPHTAIFVTDTPQQIKKKINAAVSGGKVDKNDQLQNGADLSVDVPFALLACFLSSDAELERIRVEYGNESIGQPKMLTGQIKKIAIETITEIIKDHQHKKAQITPQLIKQFMTA